MFGISFPELILILILALILFGPQKLPEIGKTLGQTIQKLKQASANLSPSMPSLSDLTNPPSTPPSYRGQVCSHCGQRWSQDFSFCPACGHRLKDDPGSHQALIS